MHVHEASPHSRRAKDDSGGHAFDRAAAMVRCVVAAETYRLTGALPEWARDEGEK